MSDSDLHSFNGDHPSTNTSTPLTRERSIRIVFDDICGTDITVNMDHSQLTDISIRAEKILDCRLMLNTTDGNKDLSKSKKRKIEDSSLSESEDTSSAKKPTKNNRAGSPTLCLTPSTPLLVGYTTTPESDEIFVPCLKIDNM